MKLAENFDKPLQSQEFYQARLDLVVPFTTPELTRTAMDAATRMGCGLDAAIRLVKIQLVPFPLDLTQSPVNEGFLREQLKQFSSELPTTGEIRLAREFVHGLMGTLSPDSVVVLGYRKRLLRTQNEKIAAKLQRAGFRVVLVENGPQRAR